jgi:hypothetical protein
MCDGGYAGPDCNGRECPRGDDPQTVCDEQDEQVQRITIGFLTTAGTIEGNSLSLRVGSRVGYGSLVTNVVTNVITGTNAGTLESIERALESLPNFAVGSVTATLDASTAHQASYLVTFA